MIYLSQTAHVINTFKIWRMHSLFMLLACLMFFSNVAFSSDKNEQNLLQSMAGTPFDSFKVADNAAISASKKIYIEKVDASFSKDWLTKFTSKTSRNYRNTTLQQYADSFRTHLIEELNSAGWEVVNAPYDGVLVASAVLSNIHISGPQQIGTQHSLITEFGFSHIEFDLKGGNKRSILQIQDRRSVATSSGTLIETNRALNFSKFSHLFKGWANDITVFINLISPNTN
ncbi:hypothetical protein [Glaciecola sp. SC05]|uniref:hypothetical protein n=1 Tax=Glaciecola sp. SC05 TaxID=1987355 RepID=UPI003529630F